jgi:hypothetical protein
VIRRLLADRPKCKRSSSTEGNEDHEEIPSFSSLASVKKRRHERPRLQNSALIRVLGFVLRLLRRFVSDFGFRI